jgi:hypothetical protein
MTSARLSQSQLFALIFDEFASLLGDSIPSADLLRAADRLARLIDVDFNVHHLDRVRERSNYYTHDIAWAFSNRAWQIACRERSADLLSDQRFTADRRAANILTRYMNHW